MVVDALMKARETPHNHKTFHDIHEGSNFITSLTQPRMQ